MNRKTFASFASGLALLALVMAGIWVFRSRANLGAAPSAQPRQQSTVQVLIEFAAIHIDGQPYITLPPPDHSRGERDFQSGRAFGVPWTPTMTGTHALQLIVYAVDGNPLTTTQPVSFYVEGPNDHLEGPDNSQIIPILSLAPTPTPPGWVPGSELATAIAIASATSLPSLNPTHVP